jgi:hypothetical protein
MDITQKLQQKLEQLKAKRSEVVSLSDALEKASTEEKVLFGECRALTELVKEQGPTDSADSKETKETQEAEKTETT